MILEKVAEHLQKDSANSISINLRGLTKVKIVSSYIFTISRTQPSDHQLVFLHTDRLKLGLWFLRF